MFSNAMKLEFYLQCDKLAVTSNTIYFIATADDVKHKEKYGKNKPRKNAKARGSHGFMVYFGWFFFTSHKKEWQKCRRKRGKKSTRNVHHISDLKVRNREYLTPSKINFKKKEREKEIEKDNNNERKNEKYLFTWHCYSSLVYDLMSSKLAGDFVTQICIYCHGICIALKRNGIHFRWFEWQSKHAEMVSGACDVLCTDMLLPSLSIVHLLNPKAVYSSHINLWMVLWCVPVSFLNIMPPHLLVAPIPRLLLVHIAYHTTLVYLLLYCNQNMNYFCAKRQGIFVEETRAYRSYLGVYRVSSTLLYS